MKISGIAIMSGVLFIALGLIAQDRERTWMSQGKIPFLLPELPYGTNGLAPHLEARLFMANHDLYHAAAVTNLNRTLSLSPALFDYWIYSVDPTNRFEVKAARWLDAMLKDFNTVPEAIRSSVRTNAGAHYNHSLFWQMMKPGGGGEPKGELAGAITNTFGNFAKFKDQFTQAALKQPGNGWVWLTLDAVKLKIETTTNEDTPFSAGRQVLLGLDLWDHAYQAQYGKDRAAYIDAWFHVVNWEFVEERYKKFKAQ